jgi:hypothetical protein
MKDFNLFQRLPILALFMVFATVNVQAQDDPVDYQNVEVMSPTGTTIYAENNTDIQGSPLIKKSFENGRILFTSGKASEVMPLNYDSYKNQVLFIKNKKVMILNTTGVKGFMFTLPGNFASSDKAQEVYTLLLRDKEFGFSEPTPIQVLYNGGSGVQLLAYHQTSLMKGNSKDPFTGKVTNRYINSTDYYLKKKNGKVIKLRRLRDNDIIKALGKKYKKPLKSFMKDNDLDGRSQKDLAKMLAYYDENLAGT